MHYKHWTGSNKSALKDANCLIHSLGGHIDTSVRENAAELSQNAISNLLQPPIVRTGLKPHTLAPASNSYNTPTVRDIPPVALTNIQHIEAADFEPYISQVGALHEQLRRMKDDTDGIWPSWASTPDSPHENYEDPLTASGQPHSTGKSLTASTTSVTAPIGRLSRQESRSLGSKGPHSPPPLSIIPDVYFNQDFHLQNPRIFEIVSEGADIVPRISMTGNANNGNVSAPKKPLATNMILQEKLSWRYNLQQLSDVVFQLKRIVDGVAYCELLVDEEEYDKALFEIDTIELLMIGKRDGSFWDKSPIYSQLRDMRGATPLRGLGNDLNILRSRIGKAFESKVHSLLLGDLQRHVQSVSPQEVLSRWEAASLRAKGGHTRDVPTFPAYMGMTEELHKALLPNVSGLHQSRSTTTAIQAYRQLVLREIRNIVRRALPSSTEDADSVTSVSTISEVRGRTNQNKSTILARNIRALDAEDAERLFSTIFIGVTETLRRVKTQSSVLLDIACAIGEPVVQDPVKHSMIQSPFGSGDPAGDASIFGIQEEVHVALDLSNLLRQAVDLGHENINKILRVRSEQAISLSLAHFLRYFTLNFFFANECEAISGPPESSLRTIINGHIQGFINAHEKREIDNLSQTMSADTWQDEYFTTKNSETLRQILECSTSDPLEWTEMSKIWAPVRQEQSKEFNAMEDHTLKDKVRGATIEEETFLLPKSAIVCLEGTSSFLRLIGGIPSMTPDIAVSLISYLQMFDSQCRQLILGAGAVRSAGLKNITTTHLALTSQALSFFTTIIPHIREFVRRHAPAGPAGANIIGEFDKLRRILHEHQDTVYQKLVEIMASRARILSKKARETKWRQESAEATRKLVMVPVITSYRNQLGEAFEKADPETETGRDCMLRDVEHLVDKLGSVEGFNDLGTYLIKIIIDKEIN
ncbi:hypothetical protein CIB48_g5638 [Xylaria polymorpha]|nr:hypothetical protein CIB48_g5638 [Xylaria polymorpha]